MTDLIINYISTGKEMRSNEDIKIKWSILKLRRSLFRLRIENPCYFRLFDYWSCKENE